MKTISLIDLDWMDSIQMLVDVLMMLLLFAWIALHYWYYISWLTNDTTGAEDC
jgi:hypothetical protein